MAHWSRLVVYPPWLKTLQVRAWLAPDPSNASRLVRGLADLRAALLGSLTLVTAGAAPPALAAPVTFFDGTFDDTMWSAIKFDDTTPGDSATFEVTQQTTGGFPGGACPVNS